MNKSLTTVLTVTVLSGVLVGVFRIPVSAQAEQAVACAQGFGQQFSGAKINGNQFEVVAAAPSDVYVADGRAVLSKPATPAEGQVALVTKDLYDGKLFAKVDIDTTGLTGSFLFRVHKGSDSVEFIVTKPASGTGYKLAARSLINGNASLSEVKEVGTPSSTSNTTTLTIERVGSYYVLSHAPGMGASQRVFEVRGGHTGTTRVRMALVGTEAGRVTLDNFETRCTPLVAPTVTPTPTYGAGSPTPRADSMKELRQLVHHQADVRVDLIADLRNRIDKNSDKVFSAKRQEIKQRLSEAEDAMQKLTRDIDEARNLELAKQYRRDTMRATRIPPVLIPREQLHLNWGILDRTQAYMTKRLETLERKFAKRQNDANGTVYEKTKVQLEQARTEKGEIDTMMTSILNRLNGITPQLYNQNPEQVLAELARIQSDIGTVKAKIKNVYKNLKTAQAGIQTLPKTNPSDPE